MRYKHVCVSHGKRKVLQLERVGHSGLCGRENHGVPPRRIRYLHDVHDTRRSMHVSEPASRSIPATHRRRRPFMPWSMTWRARTRR